MREIFPPSTDASPRARADPSERVAIGEAIERELEGRQGVRHDTRSDVENFPHLNDGEKTRDIAAKAAGFGNGKTYEQAKAVTNNAAPEGTSPRARADQSFPQSVEVDAGQRECKNSAPLRIIQSWGIPSRRATVGNPIVECHPKTQAT